MDKLKVHVYMVRFGDAILVSVPDRSPTGETQTRHILIDVGNVLGGEGGKDKVFQPVIEDIKKVVGSNKLDLYVMTHEHLDHVQGLFYTAEKLGIPLKSSYAWLTASAAKDYYKTHSKAKKKLDLSNQIFSSIRSFFDAFPEEENPFIRNLMMNNNPRSTSDCVEYLRNFADETAYVYRGCNLEEKHPFHEAEFSIWAPEEDTSEYYGSFTSMALSLDPKPVAKEKPSPTRPKPPAGVDANAFYNLVDIRNRSITDNLLAIDRAANNTSVVFCLKWRGWKLLFTGDAEDRSWKTMNKYNVLESVDFLKVSHHGSRTGTPDPDILDKILPTPMPPGKTRQAVISTYPNTYSGVPDKEYIERELSSRCEVKWVDKDVVPDGKCLLFEFEG